MNPNLPQLFKETADPELPDGFVERTVVCIEGRAAKTAVQKKYLWGLFSALSLCAAAIAGRYAIEALSTSGFGSYFSLIFSDSGAVLLSKDFALVLLESLPIIGLGIFLGTVSLVLWSARKFFGQLGTLSTFGKTAY